jgi:DNA-binding LytR/AlgR family response regulator
LESSKNNFNKKHKSLIINRKKLSGLAGQQRFKMKREKNGKPKKLIAKSKN